MSNTKISKKPWGEEYLLYENKDVAIWHLTIKKGQETSFHSHPKKKTGLIVIGGAAQVDFLKDSRNILPGQKIMIRQGVFHRTKNLLSSDLELLEIETPVDKSDLIRLEDPYGRAGTPYSSDYCDERPFRKLPSSYWLKMGDCEVMMANFHHFDGDFLYALVVGGLFSEEGLCVAGPGDVLDTKVFELLITKFEVHQDTMGVLIRRSNDA
jgi:mannose-6-phosphate isomerase-like protein (cupin superfamily)